MDCVKLYQKIFNEEREKVILCFQRSYLFVTRYSNQELDALYYTQSPLIHFTHLYTWYYTTTLTKKKNGDESEEVERERVRRMTAITEMLASLNINVENPEEVIHMVTLSINVRRLSDQVSVMNQRFTLLEDLIRCFFARPNFSSPERASSAPPLPPVDTPDNLSTISSIGSSSWEASLKMHLHQNTGSTIMLRGAGRVYILW